MRSIPTLLVLLSAAGAAIPPAALAACLCRPVQEVAVRTGGCAGCPDGSANGRADCCQQPGEATAALVDSGCLGAVPCDCDSCHGDQAPSAAVATISAESRRVLDPQAWFLAPAALETSGAGGRLPTGHQAYLIGQVHSPRLAAPPRVLFCVWLI